MRFFWQNPVGLRPNQGEGEIGSLSELGERMLSWHGGMGDPVYAVGSFYISGQEYPDPDVVDDALDNLQFLLDEQESMLRGEPVMVRRGGRKVDLRKFAGYSEQELTDNVEDLNEIVGALHMAKEGVL